MSIDYQVHTDLNLIEVWPVGSVQVSDILSYANDVLSLGLLKQGTIEYYDLSGIENLHLDYRSTRTLSHTLREWLVQGWQGSVFFAPKEYQFGIIRMLGAVMESIEGASQDLMIPSREPVALSDVRAMVANRVQ